jgi:hypothetical protein
MGVDGLKRSARPEDRRPQSGGKAMKKVLSAVAAVAVIGAASLTATTDANAQWRHRGWGPGGLAAGIIGGVVIGSLIARQYGPQYVVEPGWDPYPVYRVAGPVGCPGGYWARRPIAFDAYGNPVRFSRPRFFCPEGY